MKKLTPAALLVVLSLVACDRGRYHNASQSEIASMTGGTNAYAVIKNPDRVEAFTIKDEGGLGARTDEYPIMTGPVVVPEALAADFSELLTAPATYKTRTDMAKDCEPIYGVRLKFYLETNSVDVLFCFDCNILAFAPDGKVIGTHDFDPGRPQLVRALKSAFKEDKTIQELREPLR